jgi:CRISPR-associated protein Csd1
MLLKLLFDLAQSRHLLDDLAFASKAVRWIIELDGEGNLLSLGPQVTGDEKRGKEFSCPQTTRNKNIGGVAEFLADGINAIFGLDLDPEAPMPANKRASRDENNDSKCRDFWRQIEEASKATSELELKAMLAFHQRVGSAPPFLTWGPPIGAKSKEKPAWWLRTASGSQVKLGPDNFTFRVGGCLALENETLRAHWRSVFAKENAETEQSSKRGLCLVTGRVDVSLATTHDPAIRGVRNAQPSGAKIVSFEKSAPAFSSYGQVQSLNAPTSNEAATAYGVALNWLVRQADHRLHLGGTTLCFWARESEKTTGFFAQLLNRPDSQSVVRFLTSPWAGIERALARRDLFCAVTLAGNSGRIVVRRWLQTPLDMAIENFCRWFTDLDLCAPPRPQLALTKRQGTESDSESTSPPPFAVRQLALCTAPLVMRAGRLVADEDGLSPDVLTQLYTAAIEGTAPSIALIKALLDQFYSRLMRDDHYNPLYDQSRFSLLKLILNRNRKGDTMEIKSKITADTNDPAYNCGRLLAVLAAAQEKAHEYKLEGPGVAERYFGTASVSPSSVFPLLLRLNRHHLNKIGKSDRFTGHERFLREAIQEILSLFKPAGAGAPPLFPRNLDLQSQGRFALGFYQQAAEDDAERRTALGNKAEMTKVSADPK